MQRFLSPSRYVSLLALIISLGGAGYSATGDNFILGNTNSAATQTRLVTPLAGPAFRIDNASAAAGATGMSIVTNAARPPFAINSSVKVANLNADKLDGFDSTGFVRGGGTADGQAIAEAPGANNFLGPATGGFIRLQYLCPASLGTNGTLTIHNVSSGIANLFVDSGFSNPDYLQLASGGFATYPAGPGGDSFSIQAQGGPGVETIEVRTVHSNSSNDCHAQALLMLAR